MAEADMIPRHASGKRNDLEAIVNMATEEEAVNRYKVACERMLSPGMWRSICDNSGADFDLTDPAGNIITRYAETGDYIRIDIPGPGTKSDGGYDWVQVEEIANSSNEYQDEVMCGMTLRPASPPDSRKDDTAHFFEDSASSTFIIQRKGTHIIASYHGRNERPNVAADNVIDKIRNTVVATGALAGFSELQWQMLLDAFVA